DVERANLAAALDERRHGSLIRAALAARCALPRVLVGLFATDIGFVGFDDLVGAADRAAKSAVAFCLPDAVHHEPGGFVGDAEGAVNLMAGDTALPCHMEVAGEPPLRQGNLG